MSEPEQDDVELRASITAVQCRMARAALEWTPRDLARMSGVPSAAITAFETGALPGDPVPLRRRLRAALVEAGLVFVLESERDGAGVRLSKSFTRGFVYDEQGKQVASIVGDGVYEIAQGRRIATARDGHIYTLDGDPVGTLQKVDVFQRVGSLSEAALRRLFSGAFGNEVPLIASRPLGDPDA